MTDRATRSSWKACPPTGPLDEIDYTDTFDREEWNALQQGLVPLDMDDRWFLFCEGTTLYCHRSWTGKLIYRIEFDLTQTGGAAVAKAEVIQVHHEGKQVHSEKDAALLAYLIRSVCLGQDLPFPGF